MGRLGRLLRAAGGLPGFLRTPLDLGKAVEALETRMANRETNFLSSARVIYANSENPFRRLLHRAGCEYGDLENGVRSRGVETTLNALRREGVFLSFDEFKSLAPVVRGGLAFEIRPEDFDNPALAGGIFPASTSGTRSSRPMRVPYDWNFIAAEAANECLLSAVHGISDAPQALWYPGLPGIAGIHNLFISAKYHRPPERWFAHCADGGMRQPFVRRIAVRALPALGRLHGLRLPRPEPTNLEDALRVARWLADSTAERGIAVLRGFTGSVVRAVQAAIENGLDISRAVVFTGGEPLTAARRRFIESSGARVYPRYIATETGLIGAACPHGAPPDDMHVYLDRLAVVSSEEGDRELLYTTLLPGAGKIFLNTDIGDGGILDRKPCPCLFGRLGMDVRVSEVGSRERVTIEGMTVSVYELDAGLGAVATGVGGNPDDIQFQEVRDERGFGRLRIVVSPELPVPADNRLVEMLFRNLEARDPGHRMTAVIWAQAGSVEVVTGRPEYSEGFKRRHMAKPRPDKERNDGGKTAFRP